MKTIMALMVAMATMWSSFAFAGIETFKSEEFNVIINEVNQSRQEFQAEFKKTIQPEDQQAVVADANELIPLEVSNDSVVVETKKAEFFENPRVPARAENMGRIAEELKNSGL